MDIVELPFNDFLVYRFKEQGCCCVDVDVALKILLDGGVECAVLFWPEPSSNFGNLVDLLSLWCIACNNVRDFILFILQLLATDTTMPKKPYLWLRHLPGRLL